MKRTIFVSAAFCVLLAASSVSEAAVNSYLIIDGRPGPSTSKAGSIPILSFGFGSQTNPTGLNGLVIDGELYDVTFSTTSFDSTFALGTTGSQAAATLIADAFYLAGVTELGSTAANAYNVFVEDDQTGADTATDTGSGWSASTVSTLDPLGLTTLGDGTTVYSEAAIFTAEGAAPPVPEPGTLALFGLGIAGIALGRRSLSAQRTARGI